MKASREANLSTQTNGNATWKAAVEGFVGNLHIFQQNTTSVLADYCEYFDSACNPEYRTFKGLASRSLARAAVSAPFVADTIRKVIEASAKGAAQSCEMDKGALTCGVRWWASSSDGPRQANESTTINGVSETFNSLEVVQALLYQTKGVLNMNAKSDWVSPAPSSSGSPSGTGPPSRTGSPAGASPTGAASNVKVVGVGAVFAVMVAVFA